MFITKELMTYEAWVEYLISNQGLPPNNLIFCLFADMPKSA